MVENKINIINNKELSTLCEKYGVKNLYVFGSYLTDNFNVNSDIDFLLSFKENLTLEEYTNNFFEMYYALEKLFNRKIDLITERSLSNPFLIENINQTKQLVYES